MRDVEEGGDAKVPALSTNAAIGAVRLAVDTPHSSCNIELRKEIKVIGLRKA